MNNKKLMIIGGGTGGHIFPGLEVAKYLKTKGWKIRWIGSANRMEAQIIPRSGIKIDLMNLYNIDYKKFFWSLKNILFSLKQATYFIRSFKPDIVLGMGGYISGIGCFAAWKKKIPIIIHEQNKIAGFSNRLIGKIANKKLQAFPGAFKNAVTVGNPIRKKILSLPIPERRLNKRTGPIKILVTGGSQGSWILNKIIPELANFLRKDIDIWHQTGVFERDKVLNNYKCIGYQCYRVDAFIYNISEAYNWADLMICRSGALTVSEITAVGLPAIFVPFEHKDRQQYKNAFILKKLRAAEIFDQKTFTVKNLIKLLKTLDRVELKKMAKRAHSIAIKDSTEKIAKYIMTIS